MTGTRRIASAGFAVLQRIVGYVRNKFLGRNGDQANAEMISKTYYRTMLGSNAAYDYNTYIRGSEASKPEEFK